MSTSNNTPSLPEQSENQDPTNLEDEKFDEDETKQASIYMINYILKNKNEIQEAFLQPPGKHCVNFKVYLLKRKHCGVQHPMLVENFRVYFWKQNADGKSCDGYAPDLITLPKMPCDCELETDHDQELGACESIYVDENDKPIEHIEIGTGFEGNANDD